MPRTLIIESCPYFENVKLAKNHNNGRSFGFGGPSLTSSQLRTTRSATPLANLDFTIHYLVSFEFEKQPKRVKHQPKDTSDIFVFLLITSTTFVRRLDLVFCNIAKDFLASGALAAMVLKHCAYSTNRDSFRRATGHNANINLDTQLSLPSFRSSSPFIISLLDAQCLKTCSISFISLTVASYIGVFCFLDKSIFYNSDIKYSPRIVKSYAKPVLSAISFARSDLPSMHDKHVIVSRPSLSYPLSWHSLKVRITCNMMFSMESSGVTWVKQVLSI